MLIQLFFFQNIANYLPNKYIFAAANTTFGCLGKTNKMATKFLVDNFLKIVNIIQGNCLFFSKICVTHTS